MIYDCFANDDRFVMFYYTDNTFRPKNDSGNCVGTSRTETTSLNVPVVEFNTCSNGSHQKWGAYRQTRRTLEEKSRALEECSDGKLIIPL